MSHRHSAAPGPRAPTTSTSSATPRRQGWPARRVAVAAGVAAVVGALLGGVVVAIAGPGGSSGGSGSASSDAMCRATVVAARDLPSVVTIHAVTSSGSGNGSGSLIEGGGYVLTNDHVISPAATSGELSVLYSDGRTSAATLVGRDPVRDLAVLKTADKAKDRPTIAVGSSRSLVVGQPVVAMGAPLGLASTLTVGIVSALDRYLTVPGEQGQTAHLIGAIQTDASINPGNSGGALVDCAGRQIGVNTAIATVPNSAGQAGGGSVGLGFAIPIDLAKAVADQIIATGSATHLTLGLQVQSIPASVARRAGVSQGLYVQSVTRGGPAAGAGIAAGDIVTEIDGHAATSPEQVTTLELATTTTKPVEVTYERHGSATTVQVTPAPES